MAYSIIENTISGVHVYTYSAGTLAITGGITNHHSATFSAKNHQNQLTWTEVIDSVPTSVSFFRHSVDICYKDTAVNRY